MVSRSSRSFPGGSPTVMASVSMRTPSSAIYVVGATLFAAAKGTLRCWHSWWMARYARWASGDVQWWASSDMGGATNQKSSRYFRIAAVPARCWKSASRQSAKSLNMRGELRLQEAQGGLAVITTLPLEAQQSPLVGPHRDQLEGCLNVGLGE